MMILRLGKPNWPIHSLSEMCQYAISGNLLDQSFDLSSVIKFSNVTAQHMKCFDINSSQFRSEYSLVRVVCGHRFSLLNI